MHPGVPLSAYVSSEYLLYRLCRHKLSLRKQFLFQDQFQSHVVQLGEILLLLIWGQYDAKRFLIRCLQLFLHLVLYGLFSHSLGVYHVVAEFLLHFQILMSFKSDEMLFEGVRQFDHLCSLVVALSCHHSILVVCF